MIKFISRLARIFSLLIIFLIITLGVVWLAGPWLFHLDTSRNILFINPNIDGSKSQVYFAHFSPSSQSVRTVALRADESIEVMGDYGQYKLGTAYSLLKLEKQAGEYINSAFSWALQRVVDQVVVKSGRELETRKNLIQTLRTNLIYDFWLEPQKKLQLAEIYFFTRSLPTEQVRVSSEKMSLSQLDTIVIEPLHPQCSVAVVNTTSTPGLATKMTTVLEKSGVMVVRLDDQSSAHQLSGFLVAADNDECQKLAGHVQVLFPGSVIVEDSEALRKTHRADLVVMIGNDLAKLKP